MTYICGPFILTKRPDLIGSERGFLFPRHRMLCRVLKPHLALTRLGRRWKQQSPSAGPNEKSTANEIKDIRP